MLKRFFACLLALCALTLCACGREAPPTVGGDTVTFTDDLGRSVTAPGGPRRVAALLGSFADIWMLAGGEVCATADDAWDDFALPLSEDTVNLGKTKSPSLEALLSAKPDFVLASSATAKNLEWKDVLEDANIPVAYFDVSSFEDYLRMLKICTDLTGRSDLYEQNGLAMQARIEAAKLSFCAEGHAPTVLFLRASAGYIRAKNSHGSVLGEMLADLGCVNIADSDASLLEQLSLESILLRDPDHIFIVQVGDDAQAVRENVERMMAENPAWQQLKALQKGNLHYMDKRLFHLKPNANWAEAYETLTQILREKT